MHVALLGAWPTAFEALFDSGHEVSILYENNERNKRRLAPYMQDFRYTCAVESYTQVESLWSALHHVGATTHGLDAVVPLFETTVVPGAILGALLGATSLDPAVALRCRDKAIQKEAWNKAGVPTARHVVATESTADLAALADRKKMTPPFVLKPIDGQGATETFRIPDRGTLNTRFQDLRSRRPDLTRLLLEERVPGTEWSINGMVRNAHIEWIMLYRYKSPAIDSTVRSPLQVFSVPPYHHESWYRSATQFAARCVTSLGLHDSVFHLEVFGEPDHFVAGELAARTAGGLQPSMARRTLGVDMWECAVKAMTNEEVRLPSTRSNKFYASTAITIGPEQRNLVEQSDLAALPAVVEVDMEIISDEPAPNGRNNRPTYIGAALVEGANATECRAALDRIVETVRVVNGR